MYARIEQSRLDPGSSDLNEVLHDPVVDSGDLPAGQTTSYTYQCYTADNGDTNVVGNPITNADGSQRFDNGNEHATVQLPGYTVTASSADAQSNPDFVSLGALAHQIDAPVDSGYIDQNGHPISLSPSSLVTPEGLYSNQDLRDFAHQRAADAQVRATMQRDGERVASFLLGPLASPFEAVQGYRQGDNWKLGLGLAGTAAIFVPPVRLGNASDTGLNAFRRFTADNFRTNLAQLTKRIPEGAQAHHVFPQKFLREFSEMGIDIHDPRFGAWWNQIEHARSSTEYNEAWRQFFRDNPTKNGALSLARQLAEQFGYELNF